MKRPVILTAMIAIAAGLASCGRDIVVTGSITGQPDIYPDYRDVTVPENIAPLNFTYNGDEECALLVGDRVISPQKNGNFVFRHSLWDRWMHDDSITMRLVVRREGKWLSYDPFEIKVSRDRIDRYISYRLIPPGYQGWQVMGIYQRDLESYKQTPIIENRMAAGNCVNCHTYNQREPGSMVFHARADFGGTYVLREEQIEKLNTKTDSTISALVYPYWHPGGKYIAFSTNDTRQSFFNHDPNRIEVFDSASDVVVYDTERHSISWSPLTKSADMFETFPSFSPDGKWLYFCSSKAVEGMPYTYAQAHYGLYRIAFDAETGTFGDSLECIYDAAAEGMSASFPRISPDGRWLAFTRHAYGNFSIWHKDADIWMIDLQSGESRPAELMNTDEVESYHDWSGDSRWMVFSSRRDDGLYTRLYISHIDGNGQESKPFMLPQKYPKQYYRDLMFSYNIPEFMTGKVRMSMHRISNSMHKAPVTGVKVSASQSGNL